MVRGLVQRLTAAFGRNNEGFGRYSIISKPGIVSPAQPLLRGIVRPPYAETGIVPKVEDPKIVIHSADDIVKAREAGKLARLVLKEAAKFVKVGVTTDQLDKHLHEFMMSLRVYPSPLNYRNFPKSICTSVNNVICHGIPDSRPLEDGDIVNVDVTVYTRDGFHGDCSDTFLIGDVDEQGRELVKTTHDCLMAAIDVCRPGAPLNAIGKAVDDIAVKKGYGLVKNFCGHGIGRIFHAEPFIHHCSTCVLGIQNNEAVNLPMCVTENLDRRRMAAGMIFTVEPILTQRGTTTFMWSDNWTILSRDQGRSAQFEHTVLITESGVEILTQ